MNPDPFQSHIKNLYQLVDTIQSIHNIHMDSYYESKQGRFKHLRFDKSANARQVPLSEQSNSPKEAQPWTVGAKRLIGGEWRLQKAALDEVQKNFDQTLAQIKEDVLRERSLPELKLLNATIVKLGEAVGDANQSLANLVNEFEKNPGALTPKPRVAQFSDFIHKFVSHATEEVASATEIIQGRLEVAEHKKSKQDEPKAPSPRLQEETDNIQKKLKVQEPNPLSLRLHEEEDASDENQRPPLPPSRPNSSREERPPLQPAPPPQPPTPPPLSEKTLPPSSGIALERKPQLQPAVEEPVKAPPSPKGPDLKVYHHPHFRGHVIFKNDPNYRVIEKAAEEPDEKKPSKAKGPSLVNPEQLARQKFQQRAAKGELVKEAEELFAAFIEAKKSYQKQSENLPKPSIKQPQPAAEAPPPPPIKGPPKAPPPPQSVKEGAAKPAPGAPPPPPPPGIKAKPKGVEKQAAEPAKTKVDDQAQKLVEALKAEAAYREAKSSIVNHLFPEYPKYSFSDEEIEHGYTTFVDDAKKLESYKPAHAAQQPLANKKTEASPADKEKQNTIDSISRLLKKINECQVENQKKEREIKNNIQKENQLAKNINAKANEIKNQPIEKQQAIAEELLQLNRDLASAEQTALKNNDKLAGEITANQQLIDKSAKQLRGIIPDSQDQDLPKLLANAKEYIKAIKEGKVEIKPPAQPKPRPAQAAKPQEVPKSTKQLHTVQLKPALRTAAADPNKPPDWKEIESLAEKAQKDIDASQKYAKVDRIALAEETKSLSEDLENMEKNKETIKKNQEILEALTKKDRAMEFLKWVNDKNSPPLAGGAKIFFEEYKEKAK